jgi:hypothetical protein
MFKRLLKFEMGFQARQIGFWVVLLVMLAYGVFVAVIPDLFGSGLGGTKIKANGAQMIAGGIANAYLPVIFFGGIFVVTGILRDKTSNMTEIIHSTPISTFDMTASRMTGVFLIIFLSFFVFLLAQFLGSFSPTLDKLTLGPIRPLYYLQPLLLFTLVNALFVTAFFTLIAGLTHNRMLVLVSAIGLFFFSIMSGVVIELDIPKWAQALADPFGAIAYTLDTEFWSTEDRNTRLTPIFGYLGLNRLVWGVISLGVLALVFKRFKRGIVTGKTKLRGAVLQSKDIPEYKSVQPKFGFAADLAALWTRTKFEYLTTVRSVPFIILASLAMALFAFLIIVTVFFSPQKLVPTSLFMVSIGFASFLIPVLLIIAFFSAEMVFRDRGAKFVGLLDSTKVRNWSLLVAKWLALSAALATLCVMVMLVGMAIQIAAGGPPVNLSLYLKFTFLNAFPNYLAFAFLGLFVQAFVPNRIVGMLVAAGAMAFVALVVSRLPFYHPLMGFGGTSPGQVSEISPYNSWVYFRWFNFYWGALCVLFAVLSVWLWRRGFQVSLLRRLKEMKTNITPASGAVAAVALAAFIGSGIYIYQAYDKVDYANQKAREKRQVKAEKMLATERDLPHPHVRSVSIEADIFPEKQEATVSGKMMFENASGVPISEIYVNPASGHEEDVKQFDLNGAVELTEGTNAEGDSIEEINDLGVRVFRFEPALDPGDKTELDFETFFHGPRLADRSAISKDGTFLNNYGGFGVSSRVIPTMGVPDLRIRNSKTRRKYDLPELEKLPEPTDPEAGKVNLFGTLTGPADYIDFEGTVCTAANQIPIAPGDLITESVEGDRRCRTYRSDTPISNFFSILSGNYAVTEDSWTSPTGKTIPIRVYHAESHSYSVQDMIKATKFGLTHYSENFGPYQYNYFRIMEVPFIGFAQAFAGTIPYAEQGFIMDSGEAGDVKTLDNASITTLHELGHQWFAHQIVPGRSRGFNVLSEGLTSYATMDAYEALYGFDKALYALENSTIAQMQALAFIDREKEVPLALAGEQQYLVYNKADWVMWGLKHYIGPDKMRLAMRNLIDEFGSNGPPYPTTKDVTDALREVAGPDYDQLITDQWDRIVWWDMKFGDGELSASKLPNGRYQVTFPFEMDKKIQTEDMESAESFADIDGESLNEWVEIGFYQDEPEALWSNWTTLEKVRVTQAESELVIELETLPAHIAIDPRRLLMERNVEDNVKPLSTKLASTE